MASAAKRRKAARKKKKKEVESQVTSNPQGLENGDLINENEKDRDGVVEVNSPTSEDHPNGFGEGNEELKSGQSLSPPHASKNKHPDSNAVVRIVEKEEARVDLQIKQRNIEEDVGDENDGRGSELKSNGIPTVKVVEKEETKAELESTSICVERLESAKEYCNGESESLPTVNSAENRPEVPVALKMAQRASWINCCGLLDVITGSRT